MKADTLSIELPEDTVFFLNELMREEKTYTHEDVLAMLKTESIGWVAEKTGKTIEEVERIITINELSKELRRERAYNKKLEIARQILEIDPQNVIALNEVSEHYLYRKDFTMAEKYTQDAINASGETVNLRAQGNLVEVLSRKMRVNGSTEDEDRMYQAAEILFANEKINNISTYISLFLYEKKLGSVERYYELVNEAYSKYPQAGLIVAERAKIYVNEGKFDKALEIIGQSKLGLDSTDLREVLCSIYSYIGDVDGMHQLIHSIQGYDARIPTMYCQIGEVDKAKEEAIKNVNTITNKALTKRAMEELLKVYIELGDAKNARVQYEIFMDMHGRMDAKSGGYQISIYILEGKLQEAEELYRELIKSIPERNRLKAYLVKTYIEAGKYREAEAMLLPEVEAFDENSEYMPLDMYHNAKNLSYIYLKEGDITKASKTISLLQRYYPNNIKIRQLVQNLRIRERDVQSEQYGGAEVAITQDTGARGGEANTSNHTGTYVDLTKVQRTLLEKKGPSIDSDIRNRIYSGKVTSVEEIRGIGAEEGIVGQLLYIELCAYLGNNRLLAQIEKTVKGMPYGKDKKALSSALQIAKSKKTKDGMGTRSKFDKIYRKTAEGAGDDEYCDM